MLPAKWRKQHGLAAGSELTVRPDPGGGLRVETPAQALARARAIVRKYVPPGVSLAEEIIADHRRDAARENRS
jgi:hypothetical protein